MNTLNYCFPLRPNLNVSIQDLPRDLTLEEAARLSAFLEALAVDDLAALSGEEEK